MRTLSHERVEMPHQIVRCDRGPFACLPARIFEALRIGASGANILRILEHFERGLTELREASEPVSQVSSKLRTQAVEIRIPRRRKLEIRGRAALPDACLPACGGRKLVQLLA